MSDWRSEITRAPHVGFNLTLRLGDGIIRRGPWWALTLKGAIQKSKRRIARAADEDARRHDIIHTVRG